MNDPAVLVSANQWTGPAAVEPRLWARIDASGDCWLWTGTLSDKGYGQLCVNNAIRWAHRVVYELLVGPIAAGMQLDHLCRVPACVNPDHLEPVTRRENILRGHSVSARAARQSQCIHGHPLQGDNLFATARAVRRCRTCDREGRARRVKARAA